MCDKIREIVNDLKGTWLILTSILLATVFILIFDLIPVEEVKNALVVFLIIVYFWLTFSVIYCEEIVKEKEDESKEIIFVNDTEGHLEKIRSNK